ncbi:MAG: tetratricopeptide repeat protein [Phycisphaerae bacterium]|nr:tetratricopeptide repeat protein [Phycisphaerae bacterium]
MDFVKRNLAAVGGGALALAIVAVLAIADASRFEDAEYSPLYRATLQDAYSKFKESDRKVPAKGAADVGAEAMFTPPVAMPQQPMGSPPAAGGKGLGSRLVGGSGPGATQPPAAPADDGGVHMKLGNDHLAKGEFDKAIAEYRLALQEDPNRALAAHQLADALRYSGRFDEALTAYDDVLKRFPSYICCNTHIADMYRDRKNQTKADEYYDKATGAYEAQVKSGGPQAIVGKYHLAKLYVDRGRNVPEAVRLVEEVVAAAPDQAMYYQLLAQCYQAVGRKQDAISAIDKAISLNPPNVAVFQQYKQQLLAPTTQPVAAPNPS